jgi:thioesterase domain-containing protein
VTTRDGWRPLGGSRDRDDGDRGVVLAVDLFAPGRPEAAFEDLAPLLASEYPIWETVQPPPSRRGELAGRDAYWVSKVRESGREAIAVLGYCVGAIYARAVAERLGRLQPAPPTLVLLDPGLPDPAEFLAQFHSALDRLAAMLAADELARARHAGARAAGQSAGLFVLADALTAIFGSAVRSAFGRAGISDRIGAEVSAAFAAMLEYFAEAGQLAGSGPAAWTVPAVVLCSREGTASDPARSGVPVISVDVTHAHLLGSRAVARHVDRLLAGAGLEAASER